MIAGEPFGLDDTITEYMTLQGGGPWRNAFAGMAQPVSTDGIIKNLRVKLAAAPGAGKKYTFTLMLNGAPTALTFDIADVATTGSNMVNEIDVTGGDLVAIECNPDGTPAVSLSTWTIMFEGDNDNESIIFGRSENPLDVTLIEYATLMSARADISGTPEDLHRQVVPTDGTLKNLYVWLSEDPGTAPDAYRFTVRVNGVSPGGGLLETIVAPDTTGSDLVNDIDVVAGDILTLMIEPLNGPAAIPTATWGLTFVADVDGESIMLGGINGDLHDTDTKYAWLQPGTTNSGWGPERLQLGQPCTLKKLYVQLTGSPGAGNKYTFTVQIAGGDSNVVVEIADAATTGNSGVLEDTVGLDDYLSLKVVPDDTPTVRDAFWGIVSFRQPPWSGKISGVVNPASIMGVLVENIATVKGVASG